MSQIRQLMLLLVALLLLHAVCMIVFEQMHWLDAVWLTFTTATTVGFGDFAPRSIEGRIATVLLLYGGGIIILARIGGLYFDYLMERRMKILQGKWHWEMRGHIVFINSPVHGAAEYFRLAIEDLRESAASMAGAAVVIHSDQFADGLPEEVRRLEVAHVHSPSVSEESLGRASVLEAGVVVILAADNGSTAADSVTFDLIHRLRDMGYDGRIIAEVVRQDNKRRLLSIGANTVIRPIRSYPELLIRSIIAPGTEQVIEELISHNGAVSIRYDIALRARWSRLQAAFADQRLGVLIGYVDGDGHQVLSPEGADDVDVQALIAIVREDQVRSLAQVLEALRSMPITQ
ncbi:MAG: NAD-binding protein [Pseudomonadales bacterium]|nr:NAD-binding protein [Pseudomonadales bacterium]